MFMLFSIPLFTVSAPVPLCDPVTRVVVDLEAPQYFVDAALESIEFYNEIIGRERLRYAGRMLFEDKWKDPRPGFIEVRRLTYSLQEYTKWEKSWANTYRSWETMDGEVWSYSTKPKKKSFERRCLLGATIVMRTDGRRYGKPLTLRQNTEIMMHEFGHALGWPHTEDDKTCLLSVFPLAHPGAYPGKEFLKWLHDSYR